MSPTTKRIFSHLVTLSSHGCIVTLEDESQDIGFPGVRRGEQGHRRAIILRSRAAQQRREELGVSTFKGWGLVQSGHLWRRCKHCKSLVTLFPGSARLILSGTTSFVTALGKSLLSASVSSSVTWMGGTLWHMRCFLAPELKDLQIIYEYYKLRASQVENLKVHIIIKSSRFVFVWLWYLPACDLGKVS